MLLVLLLSPLFEILEKDWLVEENEEREIMEEDKGGGGGGGEEEEANDDPRAFAVTCSFN
jgi:hypothetical protein